MDDTAREMFAQLVHHYRARVGSQSECAHLLGYSVSSLWRIEAGQRVPRADSLDEREMGDVERRQLLARALGLVGTTGLAGTFGHLDAVRATLDDALGRSVEEWQEVAFDYGRDYLTLPPADLIDELAQDVLAVRRLLDRPRSVIDRPSLQRVAAQLSAVMAMTLVSLGEISRARAWWRTAVIAADRSRDLELATWVRALQAGSGRYDGRSPNERLTMADAALARAPSTVGAGRVAALADRAQALARLGDAAAATTAVEDVADAFEQLPAAVTTDCASVYGWPQRRLRHVQTYVYAHTGDSRVTSAHDAALASYPPGLFQGPAQVKLYRAAWIVGTGDPSEGLRQATRAVADLPSDYRDHAVVTVARDVERVLPAGTETSPEAAEYRELLAAPESS